MGFITFTGRVLFSAIFIFSAWLQWLRLNESADDGGAAALRDMDSKVALFRSHVVSALGIDVPNIEIKYLVMAAMGMEGVGAILFTFGSSLGAYLLLIFLAAGTSIVHDFYNYDLTSADYAREFVQFLKNLSLFGGLLFFLGMRNMACKNSRRGKAKAN